MKKIYIISLVLFLGFSLQIQSQEDVTTTLLTGTWTFNYQESILLMDTASKAHYDSISPVRQERINQSYIGRIVNFNSDSSYVQTLANGQTAGGTWILSSDKQTVIITDPNGNTYTQQITLLSATKLILKPVLESNVRMLIPKWSFIKS